MNKKRKHTGQTINHSLSNLIAVGLSKLIENRDESENTEYEHIVHGINLSIQQSLNSMVEGFLKDLIKEKLKQERTQLILGIRFAKRKSTETERLYLRLLNEKFESLEKSSWKELREKFKSIFGKPISEIVGEGIFNSMVCQFRIRNIIAHGNTIEVEIYQSEENQRILDFETNYKKAVNYLEQEKLITITNPRNLKLIRIFNTKTTDHFVKYSIKFIEALSENLEGFSKKSMSFMILNDLEQVKLKYVR